MAVNWPRSPEKPLTMPPQLTDQEPDQGGQGKRTRHWHKLVRSDHTVATLPTPKHVMGDAFKASPSFVPKEGVWDPPENLHPQSSQIGCTGHKFGLRLHFKRKAKVFHAGTEKWPQRGNLRLHMIAPETFKSTGNVDQAKHLMVIISETRHRHQPFQWTLGSP